MASSFVDCSRVRIPTFKSTKTAGYVWLSLRSLELKKYQVPKGTSECYQFKKMKEGVMLGPREVVKDRGHGDRKSPSYDTRYRLAKLGGFSISHAPMAGYGTKRQTLPLHDFLPSQVGISVIIH